MDLAQLLASGEDITPDQTADYGAALRGEAPRNMLFQASGIDALNRLGKTGAAATNQKRQGLLKALEAQKKATATKDYRDSTLGLQRSSQEAAQAERVRKQQQVENTLSGGAMYNIPGFDKPQHVSSNYLGDKVITQTREPVDMTGASKVYKPSAASTGFNKPTAKQQKEFEATAALTDNTNELVSSYRPEYAGGTVPGGGSLSNYVSREAPILASDEMKAKQNWWANYKKQRELTERHELFGSALTATEQEQWRQATINPNMEDSQIQTSINTMQRLQNKIAKKAAGNAAIKGWDPEYIAYNFDVEESPNGDVTTTEIDFSVTPEGEDPQEWAELTDEERQEYYE
tara:strand:+ start:7083 stop:8120 length:1038 start_codon:yes stop_codon:yes gene_type:complete